MDEQFVGYTIECSLGNEHAGWHQLNNEDGQPLFIWQGSDLKAPTEEQEKMINEMASRRFRDYG